VFIDASALCAILLREPGWELLEQRILDCDQVRVSPMTVWETVLAVVRESRLEPGPVRVDVQAYIASAGAVLLPIAAGEGEAALDAFERFGKGRHAAALNMGDCFAYGCAKANGLPLLFKGDDFVHTDIERA